MIKYLKKIVCIYISFFFFKIEIYFYWRLITLQYILITLLYN